ncbi:MAG: hypothetical protein LAT58_05685, partial [Opitutales bacterium]|nr:hypothetical protein [Opitutales bacterium]
ESGKGLAEVQGACGTRSDQNINCFRCGNKDKSNSNVLAPFAQFDPFDKLRNPRPFLPLPNIHRA